MLVEGDGVCTWLEVDFEAPDEILLVVLSRNHQVVSTWRNAGQGTFAGGIGSDSGCCLGADRRQSLLTFGCASCADTGHDLRSAHALGNGEAALLQSGVIINPQKNERAASEGIKNARLRRESTDNGQNRIEFRLGRSEAK